MNLNSYLKLATNCFRIGVAGPKGSGKTYLANWLSAKLSAQVISFAAPIKHIASYQSEPFKLMTNVHAPMGFLATVANNFKHFPIIHGKNRELLQYIGALGRVYDPDLWVKMAIQALPKTGIVIFDDLRYANEALIMDYIVEIDAPYSFEHESESANWRIYDGNWYYKDIAIAPKAHVNVVLKDFYDKVYFNKHTNCYHRF
jgi:hypothetical protein